MTVFGNRLRDMRIRKGLTMRQFSERFQISESAVGMYERNQREPSLALLSTFADYFGVTIDDLVGRHPAAPATMVMEQPAVYEAGQSGPPRLKRGRPWPREADSYTDEEWEIGWEAAQVAIEAYRKGIRKGQATPSEPPHAD